MTTLTLCDCGHAPSDHSPYTTGYGVHPTTGETFCYACCAQHQREIMRDTGKTMLYLDVYPDTWRGIGVRTVPRRGKVTDWAGHLSFPCTIKKGRHNMAGTRYDVWFTGPDGYIWHGVQYGEWTQLCHCKRTKERANS